MTSTKRYNQAGLMLAAILIFAMQPVVAQGQDDNATLNEKLFWQSVECERKPEVALYLQTYPHGLYTDEARACLNQIAKVGALSADNKIRQQLLQWAGIGGDYGDRGQIHCLGEAGIGESGYSAGRDET